MNKNKRAKMIEELIRKEWESLESHLQWTHRADLRKKTCSVCRLEDYDFHKKCVADYAQQIMKLTALY